MLRKALVLTFAILAVFATAAQAHTAVPVVSCGSANIAWSDFSATGTGNGGYNSPTYSVTFTPVGAGAPTVTVNGQVLPPAFAGTSYTLPTPIALPTIDGTVVIHTAVTAAQTRDRTTGSLTQSFNVTGCPTISTTATPSTTVAGAQFHDVAHLGGGISPTGTITFSLYANTTCTGTPVQTVTNATVNGDGDYSSPSVTAGTGTYTWLAVYSGDSANPNNVPLSGGCDPAHETVVITPATPALTTTASPQNAPVGTAIQDVAHLTGGDAPTGTISFSLYGPTPGNCTGTPVKTVTTPVSGDKDYASPFVTPTGVGTYVWVASYNGDANNAAQKNGCAEATETVVITPLTPVLTTSATPATAAVNTPITDVATLSGGSNPQGTLQWQLYGPNDANCTSATPLQTAKIAVTGDGQYTSPSLTPTTVGAYHWVATFLANDANDTSVGPVGCADSSEAVKITPVSPAITTSATPQTAVVGQPIADVAQLTGGFNPTGTITFNLYGPTPGNCTGQPAETVTKSVTGDGPYTSPSVTPTGVGTYVWVATYNGDTNNGSTFDGCAVASETVTITPIAPALTTSATPVSAALGTAIKDTATLSGGNNPQGTLQWSLYGPADNTCSSSTPLTTSTVAVTGDGQYTSPALTPTTVGTYHWVATFKASDANDSSVGPVGCADASETVTVLSLTTTATPSSVAVGQPVHDVAHLSGGNNPGGTISFSLYGPTPGDCTGTPVQKVTTAVTSAGDYNSPDITPTGVGTYVWVATYSGDANNITLSNGCAEASETVTVAPVAPTLTTSATPPTASVGAAITDVATLAGGNNPHGTLQWSLYGPSDDTCSSATPMTTATVAVTGDGNYTSPAVTPTAVGTYHWVALFTSSDANDSSVGPIGCTDPSETVTITPVTPTLTTTATPPTVTLGTPVADVAHLGGGDNPTGTITFNLYGPNDTTNCTGTPVQTVTTPVSGDADYTSPTVTMSGTGTYVWVATYNGDANNAPLSDGCAVASETVTVTPPLTLTTTASPSTVTLGTPVADVAHLGGGNSPTGTITFKLYGPNDTTGCTGTPVQTVTTAVTGDADYTSPTVTMTGAGTYVWVATYSGDANNVSLSDGCAEASETVTVTPPVTPSVTPAPGFSMQKLESDPESPTFTAGPITADIGQTISYEVLVKNTGNTTLDLALVDTLCTGISGPTGTISGSTLAVGATATYTCSHLVVAGDFPTYVNVAQITATPPGAAALTPQRSSVLANIPASNVLPACIASPIKIKQTTTNKGATINAIVSGGGLMTITFYVDGRATKTLTKPNLSGGRFELTINVGKTRYGSHAVTTKGMNSCKKAVSDGLTFNHNAPLKKIVPRFTG